MSNFKKNPPKNVRVTQDGDGFRVIVKDPGQLPAFTPSIIQPFAVQEIVRQVDTTQEVKALNTQAKSGLPAALSAKAAATASKQAAAQNNKSLKGGRHRHRTYKHKTYKKNSYKKQSKQSKYRR